MKPQTESRLIIVLSLLIVLSIVFGLYNWWQVSSMKSENALQDIRQKKEATLRSDSIREALIRDLEAKLTKQSTELSQKMDSMRSEIKKIHYENKKLVQSYSSIVITRPEY